jgi:hypothetical protein
MLKNEAVAEAFFNQAKNFSGFMPEQITTDKEAALYPAIKSEHQAIKSRIGITKGFRNIFLYFVL